MTYERFYGGAGVSRFRFRLRRLDFPLLPSGRPRRMRIRTRQARGRHRAAQEGGRRPREGGGATGERRGGPQGERLRRRGRAGRREEEQEGRREGKRAADRDGAAGRRRPRARGRRGRHRPHGRRRAQGRRGRGRPARARRAAHGERVAAQLGMLGATRRRASWRGARTPRAPARRCRSSACSWWCARTPLARERHAGEVPCWFVSGAHRVRPRWRARSLAARYRRWPLRRASLPA